MIDKWAEAWAAAITREQRDWLQREAERRGEAIESLCGLIRSTYTPGELDEALKAVPEVTERLAASLETLSDDFGDPAARA